MKKKKSGKPEKIIQTTFLVPIREDKSIGNGELHPEQKWECLTEKLYLEFSGWTIAPNFYPGGWINPKTGERIEDESRKYFVDIKKKELSNMKMFIKEIAVLFVQQYIRFEHEGEVEYISGEEEQ